MTQFTVACIGIVKQGNDVLVVKEGKAEGKWAFPGGKLEKDEKLEDCVEREIKEETGLETRAEELIGTYIMIGDNSKQMFVYAFKCSRESTDVNVRDVDSVEDAGFVGKESFNNLSLRFEQMEEILKDSETGNSDSKINYI